MTPIWAVRSLFGASVNGYPNPPNQLHDCHDLAETRVDFAIRLITTMAEKEEKYELKQFEIKALLQDIESSGKTRSQITFGFLAAKDNTNLYGTKAKRRAFHVAIGRLSIVVCACVT